MSKLVYEVAVRNEETQQQAMMYVRAAGPEGAKERALHWAFVLGWQRSSTTRPPIALPYDETVGELAA